MEHSAELDIEEFINILLNFSVMNIFNIKIIITIIIISCFSVNI